MNRVRRKVTFLFSTWFFKKKKKFTLFSAKESRNHARRFAALFRCETARVEKQKEKKESEREGNVRDKS